jgi:hypothetical protein
LSGLHWLAERQHQREPGNAQGSHKPVDTQPVPGSLTWVVEVWWKDKGCGELQQQAAAVERGQTGRGGEGKEGEEEEKEEEEAAHTHTEAKS